MDSEGDMRELLIPGQESYKVTPIAEMDFMDVWTKSEAGEFGEGTQRVELANERINELTNEADDLGVFRMVDMAARDALQNSTTFGEAASVLQNRKDELIENVRTHTGLTAKSNLVGIDQVDIENTIVLLRELDEDDSVDGYDEIEIDGLLRTPNYNPLEILGSAKTPETRSYHELQAMIMRNPTDELLDERKEMVRELHKSGVINVNSVNVGVERVLAGANKDNAEEKLTAYANQVVSEAREKSDGVDLGLVRDLVDGAKDVGLYSLSVDQSDPNRIDKIKEYRKKRLIRYFKQRDIEGAFTREPDTPAPEATQPQEINVTVDSKESRPPEYVRSPENKENPADWVVLGLNALNRAEIETEATKSSPDDKRVERYWDAINDFVDRIPTDFDFDLRDVDSELADYLEGQGREAIGVRELMKEYAESRRRFATRYGEIAFGSGSLVAYGVETEKTEAFDKIAKSIKEVENGDYYLITHGHRLFGEIVGDIEDEIEVQIEGGQTEKVKSKEVLGRVSEGRAMWSDVGMGHRRDLGDFKSAQNDELAMRRLQNKMQEKLGSNSVERMARYVAWANASNLMWDREHGAILGKGAAIKKAMSPEYPNIKAYLERGAAAAGVVPNVGMLVYEDKRRKLKGTAEKKGLGGEDLDRRYAVVERNQDKHLFYAEKYGVLIGDLENSVTVGVVNEPKLNFSLLREAEEGRLKVDYLNRTLEQLVDEGVFEDEVLAASVDEVQVALQEAFREGRLSHKDLKKPPEELVDDRGLDLERKHIFTNRTLASFYLNRNYEAKADGFEQIPYLKLRGGREYFQYYTSTVPNAIEVVNETTKAIDYRAEQRIQKSITGPGGAAFFDNLEDKTLRFIEMSSPQLNQRETNAGAIRLRWEMHKVAGRNQDQAEMVFQAAEKKIKEDEALTPEESEVYAIEGVNAYTSPDDVAHLSTDLRDRAVEIMNDPEVQKYFESDFHDLKVDNANQMAYLSYLVARRYLWSGSADAEARLGWHGGTSLDAKEKAKVIKAIQKSSMDMKIMSDGTNLAQQLVDDSHSWGFRSEVFD